MFRKLGVTELLFTSENGTGIQTGHIPGGMLLNLVSYHVPNEVGRSFWICSHRLKYWQCHLVDSMDAETSWISVILAPTWKQVGGLSHCLPIKIQRTSLSI